VPMHWTRKLPEPIVLKDGRQLELLGDVADLIIARSGRRPVKEHWRRTAEFLQRAAAPSARDIVIVSFASQLRAALEADESMSRPSGEESASAVHRAWTGPDFDV
jgi:hypothetical protein